MNQRAQPWTASVLAAFVATALASFGCGKSSSRTTGSGSGSSEQAPALSKPVESDAAETPSDISDDDLQKLAGRSVELLENLAKSGALVPDCAKIALAWEPLLDIELSNLQRIWDLQGQPSTADRLDRAFDALATRSGAALEGLMPIMAACETHPAIISARETLASALR